MPFDAHEQSPYTVDAHITLRLQDLKVACGVCGAHFFNLPVVVRPISPTELIGRLNRKRRIFEMLAIGKQACKHLRAMRLVVLWSPLREFSTVHQITFFPGIRQGPPDLPSSIYTCAN